MKTYLVAVVILLFQLSFFSPLIEAGAQSSVQCGSVVEGEFTENGQWHNYFIDLAPGDVLQLYAETLGDFLYMEILIYAPTTGVVAPNASGSRPAVTTKQLSERGTYTIKVHSGSPKGVGIYTLYVGCTLRDGTVINPGETLIALPSANLEAAPQSQEPSFSGFGFPGIDPVDFPRSTQLPITAGDPISGVISDTEVLEFVLLANEGDALELTFSKVFGNQNLALAVVSPDARPLYLVSLVISETASTRLILPTTGEYTIGVFRVELDPPESPELTVFQIAVVKQQDMPN